MNLTDKTIVVVGGSSGIGLQTVQNLHKQGAHVIALSRHSNDQIDQLGIQHIAADVLNDDLKACFGSLPETLHGLVYAPGSITLKPFHGLQEEQWHNDWQINVMGAVRSVQAALKQLKKSKDASIVFYSTVAVSVGMPYHASIASAKAAVEGLGKSLAAELANSNIRVNTIAPSLTNSPLASNLLSTDDKKESAKKRHPLGRYGETGDIAGLTTFLLSDEASWMTGQVINVDGGMAALRSL